MRCNRRNTNTNTHLSLLGQPCTANYGRVQGGNYATAQVSAVALQMAYLSL